MRPNRSMPAATVIPELAYPDIGEAAAWLSGAFGFRLRLGIGDHRAQMTVGDGAVVLTRGTAGTDQAHAVMVRIDDVAAHHARAVRHGAEILRPPADYPYGERQYTSRDPAGHVWTFSETIADVAPEDWGGQVPT